MEVLTGVWPVGSAGALVEVVEDLLLVSADEESSLTLLSLLSILGNAGVTPVPLLSVTVSALQGALLDDRCFDTRFAVSPLALPVSPL